MKGAPVEVHISSAWCRQIRTLAKWTSTLWKQPLYENNHTGQWSLTLCDLYPDSEDSATESCECSGNSDVKFAKVTSSGYREKLTSDGTSWYSLDISIAIHSESLSIKFEFALECQASKFQIECTCPSGKWIVNITCPNVPFTCLKYIKPVQLMWKSEICSHPSDKCSRYCTCRIVIFTHLRWSGSDDWNFEHWMW